MGKHVKLSSEDWEKLDEEGYKVVTRLGSGGFGEVLKVNRGGRHFACKLSQRATISSRLSNKFFPLELQFAMTLHHEHIIRFQQAFQSRSTTFLITELAKRDLGDMISDKGYLSERKTMSIVEQIGEGLAYLHRKNVSHGDIKPENVLMVSTEVAKLGDLGLATYCLDTSGNPLWTRAEYYTLHYAPPEVLRRKMHRPIKADAWSVGVLLYECLTGNLPYPGHSKHRIINQQTIGPVIPAYLSSQSTQLIEALLHLSPSSRWTSTRTVRYCKTYRYK